MQRRRLPAAGGPDDPQERGARHARDELGHEPLAPEEEARVAGPEGGQPLVRADSPVRGPGRRLGALPRDLELDDAPDEVVLRGTQPGPVGGDAADRIGEAAQLQHARPLRRHAVQPRRQAAAGCQQALDRHVDVLRLARIELGEGAHAIGVQRLEHQRPGGPQRGHRLLRRRHHKHRPGESRVERIEVARDVVEHQQGGFGSPASGGRLARRVRRAATRSTARLRRPAAPLGRARRPDVSCRRRPHRRPTRAGHHRRVRAASAHAATPDRPAGPAVASPCPARAPVGSLRPRPAGRVGDPGGGSPRASGAARGRAPRRSPPRAPNVRPDRPPTPPPAGPSDTARASAARAVARATAHRRSATAARREPPGGGERPRSASIATSDACSRSASSRRISALANGSSATSASGLPRHNASAARASPFGAPSACTAAATSRSNRAASTRSTASRSS